MRRVTILSITTVIFDTPIHHLRFHYVPTECEESDGIRNGVNLSVLYLHNSRSKRPPFAINGKDNLHKGEHNLSFGCFDEKEE